MVLPSFKKVFMDLWSNKLRTILTSASIAVGVFAVGLIANTFNLVYRDMTADYQAINPHTAMIFSEPFDQTLVSALQKVPGVESIEGRFGIWIDVISNAGNQYPINIHSIGPIDEIVVDQLTYQLPLPPLRENEIYLERQGCQGLGLQPGDDVELILKSGKSVKLRIAGIVHDVNANPFYFTHQTSGYVKPSTMEKLGGSDQFNLVTLVTSGSHTDRTEIQEVTERVADRIRKTGRQVFDINIINPGQHPAKFIIDTVLLFMGFLGIISVILSAFLVTNTISAVMMQQVRYIGIMKSIGAKVNQLIGMYLGLLICYGFISLLLAVPLSWLASYSLSSWLIGMLNATPSLFTISILSIWLQIIIGLAVPIIAGFFPVIKSSQMTVRQAISNYGISSTNSAKNNESLARSFIELPRPILLSLRNTFRKKERLFLTLATMIFGGAIFISIISIQESLHQEVSQSQTYTHANINVNLENSYKYAFLKELIREVPGIQNVEYWWVKKVDMTAANGKEEQILLYAPPANTNSINPVMIEGRWLLPSDDNAVVVDNLYLSHRPETEVGDTIKLNLNDREYPFIVVGVFRIAGNSTIPSIFINNEAAAKRFGKNEMVNSLHINTTSQTIRDQQKVRSLLQTRFEKNSVKASFQIGNELLAQDYSKMDILVYLLLFMAILIALVGGLGLMGTMGMNVLERTREIGVMRSIGAENRSIFEIMISEGLFIAGISWLISLFVAIPIIYLLGNILGQSLLNVPLIFKYSPTGAVIWLLIVFLLAIIASLFPARKAVQMTIRDTLSYE